MKKIKQLISDFFWGIVGDILPIIIIPIVLGIIFVSFAVWYFFTKMIPRFFVMIYPLTSELLPPLVASVLVTFLYFFTQNIPLKDFWIIYMIIWLLIYSFLYAWVNQMK